MQNKGGAWRLLLEPSWSGNEKCIWPVATLLQGSVWVNLVQPEVIQATKASQTETESSIFVCWLVLCLQILFATN